jgi:uncharacterized protein
MDNSTDLASPTGQGETELSRLLATMHPHLHEKSYIFATVSPEQYDGLGFTPLCQFREREGITLILTEAEAMALGLLDPTTITSTPRWAHIELTVHSALTAVGFLAVISQRLAQAGISVNVISAYYHDHLFVPWASRQSVMGILQAITDTA